MNIEINTVADLMNALAEALNEQSHEMIDQIDFATRDWLESNYESNARANLIEAVRDAICGLAA